MARLTEKAQAFVVRAVASYRPPQEVADAVKEQFGIEIDRQGVEYYDPTKGREPAEKWVELFWKTRRAVQDNEIDQAIAHLGFRMAEYMRMYRWAMHVGNRVLAMKILKQAAKDRGGKFTNKLEHMGEGGGPVRTVNANIDTSKFDETDDPVKLMQLFNETFGG